MKTPQTAQLHEWDYRGSYIPLSNGAPAISGSLTFSIGIFQWKVRKNGVLYPGGAVRRIRGYVRDREAVLSRAMAEVARRNA